MRGCLMIGLGLLLGVAAAWAGDDDAAAPAPSARPVPNGAGTQSAMQPAEGSPTTFREILATRPAPDLRTLAERSDPNRTGPDAAEAFYDILKLREIRDANAVPVLEKILAGHPSSHRIHRFAAAQVLFCIDTPAAHKVLAGQLHGGRYPAKSGIGYTFSWEMPEPRRSRFIERYLLANDANDLVVGLKANAISKEGLIDFTITLRNVSEKAFRILDREMYIGDMLYFRSAAGRYMPSLQTVDYDPLMPKWVELKPGDERQWRVSARSKPAPAIQGSWLPRDTTLVLETPDVRHYIDKPGRFDVVALFEQEPLTKDQAPHAKIDNIWSGRAVSKPVQVEIVGPDVRAATQPAPSPATQPATAPVDLVALKQRIARLIEQLGDKALAVRDASLKELVGIGRPSVVALRAAASDKDPERALRAKTALEEIGKPSWPFHEFSVLMGTTGRWNYALTVKGDGAYTFALTRGGQTGYQAEHRLGQAHLARLVERLEAAAWLAQEGKVKTTMKDGTKYQMDLLRNDRWTSVVCYGPQGDAYAQLVRFLESVRHQETLQYRLSQGWAEAVPHIHMLDSELSALLGEGSGLVPSSPALDYLRLLDAVNALAQQGTDNQRKLAAGVAEKIRKVSATQFATPPASTRPATQPATQFVTAKNPLQVMEAAHKLMTGAREASDSARADLCQGPPDFALRDDVIVIQLPPANYPIGSNDSLMKVFYRPSISRFYLRYDMSDNLAAPYRGPFDGSPYEKLQLAAVDDLPWGEAVDGVQVRLRPDKTIWKTGEVPVFKADIRTTAKWRVPLVQSDCMLVVDDARYLRKDDSGKRAWSAGGKDETIAEIVVDVDALWVPELSSGRPLQLSPGKHTIRLGVRPAPVAHLKLKPALVLSNPVEVEVTVSGTLPATQPAATQPKPAAQSADNAQAIRIATLILELASATYDHREAAEKQLVEIGWPVVLVLREARQSKDPEVALRAARAIETIRRPKDVPPGAAGLRQASQPLNAYDTACLFIQAARDPTADKPLAATLLAPGLDANSACRTVDSIWPMLVAIRTLCATDGDALAVMYAMRRNENGKDISRALAIRLKRPGDRWLVDGVEVLRDESIHAVIAEFRASHPAATQPATQPAIREALPQAGGR